MIPSYLTQSMFLDTTCSTFPTGLFFICVKHHSVQISSSTLTDITINNLSIQRSIKYPFVIDLISASEQNIVNEGMNFWFFTANLMFPAHVDFAARDHRTLFLALLHPRFSIDLFGTKKPKYYLFSQARKNDKSIITIPPLNLCGLTFVQLW